MNCDHFSLLKIVQWRPRKLQRNEKNYLSSSVPNVDFPLSPPKRSDVWKKCASKRSTVQKSVVMTTALVIAKHVNLFAVYMPNLFQAGVFVLLAPANCVNYCSSLVKTSCAHQESMELFASADFRVHSGNTSKRLSIHLKVLTAWSTMS